MKNGTDFDWVKARASCSAGSSFELLRMQVEQDVNIRNGSDPKIARFSFKSNGKSFTVLAEGTDVYRSVRFSLNGEAIEVYDALQNELTLQATLSLGNDGKCRLRVDGAEYDFWQFRKLALEELFF